VLSSPSPREGGEEGKEGVTAAKGGEGIAAAMEEDDDQPVKVILVPNPHQCRCTSIRHGSRSAQGVDPSES
jgi:hypothetical protein